MTTITLDSTSTNKTNGNNSPLMVYGVVDTNFWITLSFHTYSNKEDIAEGDIVSNEDERLLINLFTSPPPSFLMTILINHFSEI